MYIHSFVYICICTHTRVLYVCVDIYMQIHTCVYMYIEIYTLCERETCSGWQKREIRLHIEKFACTTHWCSRVFTDFGKIFFLRKETIINLAR